MMVLGSASGASIKHPKELSPHFVKQLNERTKKAPGAGAFYFHSVSGFTGLTFSRTRLYPENRG